MHQNCGGTDKDDDVSDNEFGYSYKLTISQAVNGKLRIDKETLGLIAEDGAAKRKPLSPSCLSKLFAVFLPLSLNNIFNSY